MADPFKDRLRGRAAVLITAVVETLSGQVKKSLPVSDAHTLHRLGFEFRSRPWQTTFVVHDLERKRLELWQAARMEDVSSEGDLVRRTELRMPGYQLVDPGSFHGGTVPQRPPLALPFPDESDVRVVRLPGDKGKERLLLGMLINLHGGKGWPGRPQENRNFLCEIDRQTGELRPLIELPKDGYHWYAATSGRVAVLRHLRRRPPPSDKPLLVLWDKQLEIYDLGP